MKTLEECGMIQKPSAAVAALKAVLELHRPVDVEPSDTICGECSFRLPNGRYFGKVVEWPCPTATIIEAWRRVAAEA